MPIERLDSLQPIVLVGGRSRRFGRDKLREPWTGSQGGTWLVDQPRLTLEAIFGPRVWAIGDCDAEIALRFHRTISDTLPGSGPLGAMITALRSATDDVLMLAGDLPYIEPVVIRALITAAAQDPRADAALAKTDRVEPCIAIYRRTALPIFEAAFAAGRLDMHGTIAMMRHLTVPLPASMACNANRPEDLAAT